jgi:hypothetical protein
MRLLRGCEAVRIHDLLGRPIKEQKRPVSKETYKGAKKTYKEAKQTYDIYIYTHDLPGAGNSDMREESKR